MIDKGFALVAALALLAVSLAAEAQPAGTVRTIGIIGHNPANSFEASLRELGWVVGNNVRFERRVSTDPTKLALFAAELARIPVDVIFAGKRYGYACCRGGNASDPHHHGEC